MEYAGPPAKRAGMRASLSSASLVVTSYETLRADSEALAGVMWDYVVLDEGHIIKNAQSKVARAAKGLSAAHRLVLSGTPIQNDALEMWSLFDFLMPGYLGEQAHFSAHYVKPIQARAEPLLPAHPRAVELFAPAAASPRPLQAAPVRFDRLAWARGATPLADALIARA